MQKKILSLLLFMWVLSACGSSASEPQVITASGNITAAVEQYRALLGENNGGDPGTKGSSGYREINWDSLPDEESAPNLYAPDFFNQPEAPRARGIVLNTAGDGLMVSASAANANGTLPRFGNINPQYADIFKTFSDEKLFSPVGSNIVEATFFVPGTNTPAAVRGFGGIYADVDVDYYGFEFFDAAGTSLGKYQIPLADNGLAFVGVAFDEPVIARVRIQFGTGVIGPDDGAGDVDISVMDNFIFSEPQAIE
ncbi:MAG TPA: hypothetical protein PKE23_02115 [Anaerolineales bacterium]|nr:hypothetical protein [Anaerolineales bacterium]